MRHIMRNYETDLKTISDALTVCQEEILKNFHRLSTVIASAQSPDRIIPPPQNVSDNIVYCIGNRFRHTGIQEDYILAAIDRDTVSLIELKHGNRWTSPVKIDNTQAISKEWFDTYIAGSGHTFIKI